MKAKGASGLELQDQGKPASVRTWELETLGALVALTWIVGAIQFIHHMI